MTTRGPRAYIRFLTALAAAAFLITGTAAPARSAEPYEINVIISATGPGAFLGQAAIQSLTAIEKLVNSTGGIKGRPVHFVIADDQTAPAVAVQLATGLIAKGVPVILGSAVGATCSAMTPLFKNGPVNYCFAPVIHPVAPSFVFSAGASTRDLSLAGLRWARLHGIKKIAFLDATDTTGQDGETVSKANLALPEFAGLQLVANEHFNVTDINVNAQLARIKASGAELLYAQTVGTPFGTVLKNAYDSGLDLPIPAEFAFTMQATLPARPEPYVAAEVVAAIGSIVPALEFIGSVFVRRPGRPITDILVDNAGHGGLVCGTPTTDWSPAALPRYAVRLMMDGRTIATGDASAVLGNPITCLVWLANALSARGIPLAAGEIVTTGTCTGAESVVRGVDIVGDFGRYGTVALRFEPEGTL